MVNREIIELLRNYIHELSNSDLLLDKAILYGSYSRGDYNNESDIDIMLVSPLFDTQKDKFTPIVWLKATNIDFRIEPYMVGSKRFEEDNVSPIIQIAKSEGIEIPLP
ncbi:MAG: putative nucleotidyltransferase [Ignavibacteria bacterium]|nr:putative nucleotidyltransferase [Ignavibacteria bacterium]